jgi:hypothetical protein
MKHLPKIFTLGLLALVVFIIFIGSYAVAEKAISAGPTVEAAGATGDEGDDGYNWYEDTAIFICPLH